MVSVSPWRMATTPWVCHTLFFLALRHWVRVVIHNCVPRTYTKVKDGIRPISSHDDTPWKLDPTHLKRSFKTCYSNNLCVERMRMRRNSTKKMSDSNAFAFTLEVPDKEREVIARVRRWIYCCNIHQLFCTLKVHYTPHHTTIWFWQQFVISIYQ